MRYCERCATELKHGLIDGRERLHCPTCGFVRYCNPAPVGLAVIEQDGRLVMVQRARVPLVGYWAPPGGYVEMGESVPEAVVREAREECGLEIVIDGLIGVFSHPAVDVLIVAYRAHAVAGTLTAGDDATAAQAFAARELPPNPSPPDATALEQWFHAVIEELTTAWR